MKQLITLSALFFLLVGTLRAQENKIRTVHLESDEMDLYLDIPDTSEVQTFDVHKEHTLFGKKAVVSIYLHKGNDLGDIYMETFERELKELDEIKDHGSLKTMFHDYHRHTKTDLILHFLDKSNNEEFYEFHYVTKIGNKQFYFCSDPAKRYTLDQVMAMHKIAETLRNEK